MSLDLGQTKNMRNFQDLGEVRLTCQAAIILLQHLLVTLAINVLCCIIVKSGTSYVQSMCTATERQNQSICAVLQRPFLKDL